MHHRLTAPSPRRVLLLALALGLVLTACFPPTKPIPPHPSLGFDTCSAPSTDQTQAWWNYAPYTKIGTYIGGSVRARCAVDYPPTAAWVSSVTKQGWKLLPIWVGPQAPCTSYHTRVPLDPNAAYNQGAAEAQAAAGAMAGLGMNRWLSPVYYDMEFYRRDDATVPGSCSAAVLAFVSGWTQRLNSLGYLSGVYSSLCAGIQDLSLVYDNPAYAKPQLVWIAAWNNTPNIFGFTGACAVPDSQWSQNQRVHQYRGGHDENWGGVIVNVDSNAVDAPAFPP